MHNTYNHTSFCLLDILKIICDEYLQYIILNVLGLQYLYM